MEQNVEHMEGEQTSNNADLFDDLYMSSDEDDQNFNQQGMIIHCLYYN